MTAGDDGLVAENPFSVRHVRPGAIAFRFPPGQSCRSLLERLRAHAWWGQIVGAHGSGKSALLATLIPAVEAAGRRVVLVELHDGQRRMPPGWDRRLPAAGDCLVAVDGYEQLRGWNRRRLRSFCRRRGLGLLVTTHQSMGFADLARCAPSLETARRLVEQLTRRHPTSLSHDRLAESFHRHQGNLREVLFELYDICEEADAK